MTVDEMGGGAESDTPGEGTTINSSLHGKVEPSGDSDRGMGWVAGELVEMSELPSVTSAAATSSEVIVRTWLSTDTGRDDVATWIRGWGA
jgi:hypothetical protein